MLHCQPCDLKNFKIVKITFVNTFETHWHQELVLPDKGFEM